MHAPHISSTAVRLSLGIPRLAGRGTLILGIENTTRECVEGARGGRDRRFIILGSLRPSSRGALILRIDNTTHELVEGARDVHNHYVLQEIGV
jgi:hypothetical protein